MCGVLLLACTEISMGCCNLAFLACRPYMISNLFSLNLQVVWRSGIREVIRFLALESWSCSMSQAILAVFTRRNPRYGRTTVNTLVLYPVYKLSLSPTPIERTSFLSSTLLALGISRKSSVKVHVSPQSGKVNDDEDKEVADFIKTLRKQASNCILHRCYY